MNTLKKGTMLKAMSAVLLLSVAAPTYAVMQAMDDQSLSQETGQAAFYTAYNTDSATQDANLGFFTLGLNGTTQLNANIGHLQLGCGGVNGAGGVGNSGCDIDINNLSLSGLGSSTDVNGNQVYGTTPRSATDATLTNPFIQLAIANPTSLSTRQLVGFRLGAQAITGLLTMGNNTTSPNGLSTISGYLPIKATTGTATTQAGTFGTSAGTSVTAKVNASIVLCTSGCGTNYAISSTTQSAGIAVPSMSVPFNVGAFTINGSRQTSASVLATSTVPDIYISDGDGSTVAGHTYSTTSSGTLYMNMQTQICVAFFICVSNTKFGMNAALHGIGVNITFNEALGFIHNLPLTGNAGYLSLQQQNIHWPGAPAADIAKTGWWLSIANPVDLGVLNPTNKVDISSAYPQLATFLTNYFNTNPVSISTNNGLQALTTGGITKNIGLIDLTGNTANITLSNLQLATQNTTTNCYGSLKFC